MENKYLPIGSVCTVKGQTKKIMITGYYSVEYNGNLGIKDYSGCYYPEGMLLPNSVMSFNHSDIEKVDFVGYKNQENEKFQSNLDSLTGNNKKTDDSKIASGKIYSKIEFDENGVVISAEPIVKDTIETPIDEMKEEIKPITTNTFHKEYEIDSVEPKKNNKMKMGKIKFDENGVIIAVDEEFEEEKKDNLNDIKFDDDKPVLSNIQFDEDGNIVGV